MERVVLIIFVVIGMMGEECVMREGGSFFHVTYIRHLYDYS